MDWNNMILKLSTAGTIATPTVITMDMGLQYDYILESGAGTNLGMIGDWPLIRLNSIDGSLWSDIYKKSSDMCLRPDDVRGTSLEQFANYMRQYHEDYYENFSETFSDLVKLPRDMSSQFYCIFDFRDWDDKPDFYIDQKQAVDAFRDEYCGCYTEWSQMDDDELIYWHERLQDDLKEMHWKEFGFEYNT